MDKKINSKSGQAMIWIILGVVLAASILLFFVITREPTIIRPPSSDVSFDAESFLDECTSKYVNEAVNIMLPQGGFLKPRNPVYFNNTKIEYFCENVGLYDGCVNQHPMLIYDLETEIKNYLKENGRMIKCLDEMKREFSDRGADISAPLSPTVGVELDYDKVIVHLEDEMKITKLGETRTIKEFRIEVKSPLYDLALIANEIASQEAKYCHFEYVGYNVLYPKYKVSKYAMSQPIRIYTILDKKSGKEMNIAIRSCAIPAGY
jgi:hypothetical protein